MDIFSKLGAVVFSADNFAHFLLENDKELISEIKKEFGISIFNKEGKIDRKKFGRLVFSDRNKLKILESLIHPRIDSLSKKSFLESHKKLKKNQFIVYEIPLFFETNKRKEDYLCLVSVVSDQELIVKRVIQRSKLTIDEVLNRLENQVKQETKIKNSDYVIYNNQSLKELESQVEKTFKDISNLLSLASTKKLS